jgi:hypothetical protein
MQKSFFDSICHNNFFPPDAEKKSCLTPEMPPPISPKRRSHKNTLPLPNSLQATSNSFSSPVYSNEKINIHILDEGIAEKKNMKSKRNPKTIPETKKEFFEIKSKRKTSEQNNVGINEVKREPFIGSPTEMEYLTTLNEKEMKAFEIARNCLGQSFQLDKSNGYVSWLENK